ncbi:DUF3467 domain-containing protein [Candidatus Parcubacteria bacterium]|nr:DUF3467 domain-containing protein [Candidatus Parcubacteria bacterium]
MTEQKQLQIKVKDEDLKGAYSNLMQVIHTQEEFILDFFLVSPPQGVLASRVVLSPRHLKKLIKALQENLAKYEEKFGSVGESKSIEPAIGFNPDTK